MQILAALWCYIKSEVGDQKEVKTNRGGEKKINATLLGYISKTKTC